MGCTELPVIAVGLKVGFPHLGESQGSSLSLISLSFHSSSWEAIWSSFGELTLQSLIATIKRHFLTTRFVKRLLMFYSRVPKWCSVHNSTLCSFFEKKQPSNFCLSSVSLKTALQSQCLRIKSYPTTLKTKQPEDNYLKAQDLRNQNCMTKGTHKWKSD